VILGSSVSVVSAQRLYDGVRSLAKHFSSTICVRTTLQSNRYRGPFSGVKRGRGVTLTTRPLYCRGQNEKELCLITLLTPVWTVAAQLHFHFYCILVTLYFSESIYETILEKGSAALSLVVSPSHALSSVIMYFYSRAILRRLSLLLLNYQTWSPFLTFGGCSSHIVTLRYSSLS
jgi:hypothetical protein